MVLREYHRTRYGPNAADRLRETSAYSSEEDKERALEMAKLDERMAKAEGEEGATTSPVEAPLFNSGEAFLHSLVVSFRDYA